MPRRGFGFSGKPGRERVWSRGCFVQVRLNHPRDALCAGKSRCFSEGWILWCDSRRNWRLAAAGRFPCAFMGWVMAREIMTGRVNVVENGPAGRLRTAGPGAFPGNSLGFRAGTGGEALPGPGAAPSAALPSHLSLFLRFRGDQTPDFPSLSSCGRGRTPGWEGWEFHSPESTEILLLQ